MLGRASSSGPHSPQAAQGGCRHCPGAFSRHCCPGGHWVPGAFGSAVRRHGFHPHHTWGRHEHSGSCPWGKQGPPPQGSHSASPSPPRHQLPGVLMVISTGRETQEAGIRPHLAAVPAAIQAVTAIAVFQPGAAVGEWGTPGPAGSPKPDDCGEMRLQGQCGRPGPRWPSAHGPSLLTFLAPGASPARRAATAVPIDLVHTSGPVGAG